MPPGKRRPGSPSNLQQVRIDLPQDLVQLVQRATLERFSTCVRYDHPVFGSNEIRVCGLDESAGFELVERPCDKRPHFVLEVGVQAILEIAALPRTSKQVGPVQRLRKCFLRGPQYGRLEVIDTWRLRHGHLDPAEPSSRPRGACVCNVRDLFWRQRSPVVERIPDRVLDPEPKKEALECGAAHTKFMYVDRVFEGVPLRIVTPFGDAYENAMPSAGLQVEVPNEYRLLIVH